MRFISILMIFLIGTVSAFDFDRPLFVGELVDIALQNRPSTRQAWWNANRAAAALGSERSAYYPKFDLQTFATHGRDFKFINGPDTNYTIFGADILLSMMLYDFGQTHASVKTAKMALAAANWQTDGTIQKVMVDVLENAYEVLHAQEVMQAAVFSVEDAERMLHLAEELNRAGLNPVSDLFIAKAAYAQMKMDLVSQRTGLAIRRGKLAASLGLNPDVEFLLAQVEIPECGPLQETSALISLACQQRADLMEKRADLEKAIASQAKVRASYLPELRLSGKGGANHAVHDKANAMQYAVTVNLGMPLFTGFDALYQKRMAFADIQLSREAVAQLELEISLDVLTQSLTLEGIQEMMPLAAEDLKNSQQAYESVMEIYKAGRERMSALSEAQRQLAAARVRYSEMKTRWLVSLAQLAYATGSLVPYTSQMEKSCAKQP